MTTTKPGGYGREHFGDPMGGGGPLTVVRAWAVEGRVVRVVFSEAPTFRTAAGLRDAQNPANYRFSVDAGVATAPTAVMADDLLVRGPVAFVGNGGAADERAVDVHVDRALVEGITYRVTVARVSSALGGDLGAPDSAAFPGVVRISASVPAQGPRDNVDIACDPFAGGWFADDSGDIATQDARSGYRKRIVRRIVTPLDAYSFLKGYGVGVALKEVASLAQVASLRAEVERQELLEPETASAQVVATISGTNVLDLQVAARTRVGAFVGLSVRSGPNGFVPIPS